jgi:hypothetical protein
MIQRINKHLTQRWSSGGDNDGSETTPSIHASSLRLPQLVERYRHRLLLMQFERLVMRAELDLLG